jgi:hypothetical protein
MLDRKRDIPLASGAGMVVDGGGKAPELGGGREWVCGGFLYVGNSRGCRGGSLSVRGRRKGTHEDFVLMGAWMTDRGGRSMWRCGDSGLA